MTITFCLLFLSYHATSYFKKIVTVDHDIEGCKHLGKFRSKLLISPERRLS